MVPLEQVEPHACAAHAQPVRVADAMGFGAFGSVQLCREFARV